MKPELNRQLIPPHAEEELRKTLDLNAFLPSVDNEMES